MTEGRFRRAIRRLTAGDDEIVAEQLQARAEQHGATPVAACRARARVKVMGTIQSVTLRPRAGVPALEAEIYDGSAVLYVVWLGRRRIAGITPGQPIVVEGRIAEAPARKVMFNPDYTLLPRDGVA